MDRNRAGRDGASHGGKAPLAVSKRSRSQRAEMGVERLEPREPDLSWAARAAASAPEPEPQPAPRPAPVPDLRRPARKTSEPTETQLYARAAARATQAPAELEPGRPRRVSQRRAVLEQSIAPPHPAVVPAPGPLPAPVPMTAARMRGGLPRRWIIRWVVLCGSFAALQ